MLVGDSSFSIEGAEPLKSDLHMSCVPSVNYLLTRGGDAGK